MYSAPVWGAFDWGECNATCGNGIQTRDVECSTGNEEDCVAEDKPEVEEFCETGIECRKSFINFAL